MKTVARIVTFLLLLAITAAVAGVVWWACAWIVDWLGAMDRNVVGPSVILGVFVVISGCVVAAGLVRAKRIQLQTELLADKVQTYWRILQTGGLVAEDLRSPVDLADAEGRLVLCAGPRVAKAYIELRSEANVAPAKMNALLANLVSEMRKDLGQAEVGGEHIKKLLELFRRERTFPPNPRGRGGAMRRSGITSSAEQPVA